MPRQSMAETGNCLFLLVEALMPLKHVECVGQEKADRQPQGMR